MHHKHRHKLPTLAPAAISASTLVVSGILCALALNLPLFAQTPTPLTVSGSAYTESDATHTTGSINTAGTYAGSGIRFTGAVTVSGSSVFTVDTGTFAAITGTGHSTLALTSATASGAVSILDHSTLTLTSGTFNSTLTLASASSGTLTGSRVVGATTVREGSSLTVSAGALAAITGSNIALVSIANSSSTAAIIVNNTTLSGTLAINNSAVGAVTGSNLVSAGISGSAGGITMRETQELAVSSGSFGAVYLYNTAATPGTLTITSATTGAVTGSNVSSAQITGAKTGNIIVNNTTLSGTLTVNNSTLAAVTGSNLDTVAITGGTTGALTFRETKTFTLASATTGNLAFYNNTVTADGAFTVQNSSVGATGAGTITGSSIATFSLQNSAAGNTTLRETGLADIDGSIITGNVYHYNTAATTGALLLNSSTITGAYTGSNTRITQITNSRIGGATTVNNLSGESGTLTVNNSTLAAVTGSNLDTVDITGGTTGALTFRETKTFTLASATTGNLAFYNNTVTADGAFTVQNSSVGATGAGTITGSSIATFSLQNSAAGNTTLRETGLANIDGSTITGYLYHYNTAATTGALLLNSSTITGVYTGSNVSSAQITDAKIGNITINNTTLSGTLAINNSTVGAVTGSNLVSAGISGSASTITMRETQELAVSSGSFGAVYLYDTTATPGALTITSATTGAVTGSNVSSAQITDAKTGNVIVNNTALSGTLAINNSAVGTVTGSNLVSAGISGSAGNITMRETQKLAVSSGSFGAVYLYNTAATPGALTITSATTGAVTGSNVSSAQITDSRIGGATIINNLSGESGTLTINNSTLAAVTGSNIDTVAITGGTTGALTFYETGTMTLTSATTGAINLRSADPAAAASHALIVTGGSTGAISGSNVIVTVHDSLAGGVSVSGSGGLATVTSATLSGRLDAVDYSTLVARDVQIDSTGVGVNISNHATGTVSNFHFTVGKNTNNHALQANDHATLTVTSGTILTTGGNAAGIVTGDGSQAFIEDVDMDAWGNGLYTTGSSVITANRVNVTARTGATLWSRDGGSAIYFTSGTVHGRTVADRGGLVDVRDSQLDGIISIEGASTGIFERNNQIAGAGVTAVAVSGSSTLTMRDSAISGGVGVTAASASHVDLSNTVIDASSRGISLAGSSTATLDNVRITTNDPAAGANAAGISFSSGSSHLSMNGGAIETASGRGINLGASTPSVAVLENVNITTHGDDWANGVYAYYHYNGAFTMIGGTITTHGNTASAAIMLFGGNSTYTLQDVTIHTTGANSQGISAMFYFDFQVTGGSITTEGDGSHGIDFNGGPMNGTFDQVTVTTTGSGAHAVQLLSSATLTLTDSELRTTGEDATAFAVSDLSSLTLNNTTVTVENNAPLLQISGTGDNASTVTINGGALAGASLLHFNITGTLDGTNGITINDADLTRAGGVTATLDSAQTATLTLNGGSGLHGNITATGTGGGAGTGTLALTLNNSSLTGDTIASDHAGITITGINNATITGDVTGRDTSITSVNLSNSTLTGKTTITDAATLTLALDRSTWHMTADSTFTHLALTNGAQVRFPAPAGGGLFHTLTVTGSLAGAGAFAMHADVATGAADLLVIQGAATGAHQIALAPAANAALPTGNEAPLLLIQAAAGDATFATFTGTLAAGIYDYSLQDGAHLVAAAPNSGLTAADATNWYLHRSALSATADAIINTAAMLARDWHYTLDALHMRMGDLRAESAPVGRDLVSRRARETAPETQPGATQGRALQGNVWARARAYRLNADNDLTGRAFTQYAYGLTAGADKTFRPAAAGTGSGATLLAGAFLDMGRTDRDFAGDSATGHTDNLSAGLYGTWLSDTGWHADLVFKADRYKHRFDTLTAGAAPRPVSGAYNSTAQGISLELGRRLARAGDTAGWWIEPAAQAAIVWLQGAHYRTTPGNQSLDVTLATARAAQYRAQLRFGRQLRDTRWRPYGKFAIVKTDTAGGEIRITGAGVPFAPDYDGWRAEFGMGASYLLDERSQLYFDYEYSQAAHYERPWSLNLGYRVLW